MKTRTLSSAQRARRSGFLLEECIVYLCVFFVVGAVAFAAFYQCFDYMRGLNRNANDIVRTLHVGELWRSDVRSASGPLQAETSEFEQVVHVPRPGGEVVYLFSKGEVFRRANPAAPWVPVLPRVKSSRMLADSRPDVAAWRWELELQPARKTVRVRPLFTFLAAPVAANAQ